MCATWNISLSPVSETASSKTDPQDLKRLLLSYAWVMPCARSGLMIFPHGQTTILRLIYITLLSLQVYFRQNIVILRLRTPHHIFITLVSYALFTFTISYERATPLLVNYFTILFFSNEYRVLIINYLAGVQLITGFLIIQIVPSRFFVE